MLLFRLSLVVLALFLVALVIRFILGLVRFNRWFRDEAEDTRLQTYLTEKTSGHHPQPNTPLPSGTPVEENSGAP